LFSQEIVVESAGERVESFEALKARMWSFFNPVNPLEEMLVTDIVENCCRRRRVRHCETTELNNKFKAQETRDGLERAARLESLKIKLSIHCLASPWTRVQGLVGTITFKKNWPQLLWEWIT
jgi:hypothetical protein